MLIMRELARIIILITAILVISFILSASMVTFSAKITRLPLGMFTEATHSVKIGEIEIKQETRGNESFVREETGRFWGNVSFLIILIGGILILGIVYLAMKILSTYRKERRGKVEV